MKNLTGRAMAVKYTVNLTEKERTGPTSLMTKKGKKFSNLNERKFCYLHKAISVEIAQISKIWGIDSSPHSPKYGRRLR